MIIDTNGFEIGDEVWVIFRGFARNTITPIRFIIKGFEYYNGKITLISNYKVRCDINHVFKTQQECQLECDRLNGVNYE